MESFNNIKVKVIILLELDFNPFLPLGISRNIDELIINANNLLVHGDPTGFWDFLRFCFFGIPFKVTKVTTKSYQGYYWTPKIVKNGPKQHNKLFFARRQ